MATDALAIVQEADKLIPSDDVLKKYMAQADYMVKAGMLPPGYENASDLVVVALRGREMGIPFWQMAQGAFPVKKRIGYMGTLLLERIYTRFPGAEIIEEETSDEKCVIKCRKNPDEAYKTVTVTFKEAEALKWNQTRKYKKDGTEYWEPKATWAAPANQLYWRCISRMTNRHFAQVFGTPVYTPEELMDIPEEPKKEVTTPYPTAEKPAVEVINPAVTKPEPKKDKAPFETAETVEVKAEPAPETPAENAPTQPVEEKKEQTAEEKLQELKDKLSKLTTKKEIDAAHAEWCEKNQTDPKLLMDGFKIKKDAKGAIK